MALTTSEKSLTPARQRRHDAFERSVGVIRAFREKVTPEEMERVAASLERAFAPPTAPPRDEEALALLTGGEAATPLEKLELRTDNLARYFAWRQTLLQETLSAPQVARLLGTSRQNPHDRARAGTLLAIRDRGGLRFPRWQFDPTGPDGVLTGLTEVLAALTVSPWEQASWFVRSNPSLSGRTPVEALRDGETKRLLSLARGVGVS